MKFETNEARFDNWGMTVRMPKFQSGVCAQWAQLYVALRDAKEAPSGVTPVEKDGWLVEAAWSTMPNHVHKWVLKYTYVWRMSPEQVQTRMRKQHKAVLRGRQFEIVLAEAENSLRQHISKIHAQSFMKNLQKTGCKPAATVL
ncbi:hypothetical protein AWB76_06296 [Caballeronia temeraria]|uniref:Uncharacterized protein n=1 Tax=Caballeronia temeraria TaxID=1777137 RepID=A0A158D121_9BURK|nr:hypothetical protein [Caballeronia temeraria]SAK88203.1 hypothetical protein AWB76_06296 [Caballeronia temeraria]